METWRERADHIGCHDSGGQQNDKPSAIYVTGKNRQQIGRHSEVTSRKVPPAIEATPSYAAAVPLTGFHIGYHRAASVSAG